MTKSKPPEWQIIDLFDGRFAVTRHGLVVFTARSHLECEEWYRKRIADTEPGRIPLRDVIERLK